MIIVFLHSHGVGTARVVWIFQIYGADAVEVMTENPYRLAQKIRGIGFVTTDAIAMKLGIEKTAMVRVRAGIGYALTEAIDEGHRGLPEEELGRACGEAPEGSLASWSAPHSIWSWPAARWSPTAWRICPAYFSATCTGPSAR